jgi:hypothetical protein
VPSYPYISGQGALVQTFAQLRKGFPTKVDAGYLKRFNIAPANESYVIAILRFLGLIDEEGNRREETADFFYGGDDVFKPGLERTLRSAYSQVFDEMGDDALTPDRSRLTNWFRAADKTSDLVGQRQAATFQTLIALSGHGDVPTARANGTRKAAEPGASTNKSTTQKVKSPKDSAKTPPSGDRNEQKHPNAHDVGLTVRIEVNLPPGGDAATYDTIFASIKKHLMP